MFENADSFLRYFRKQLGNHRLAEGCLKALCDHIINCSIQLILSSCCALLEVVTKILAKSTGQSRPSKAHLCLLDQLMLWYENIEVILTSDLAVYRVVLGKIGHNFSGLHDQNIIGF